MLLIILLLMVIVLLFKRFVQYSMLGYRTPGTYTFDDMAKIRSLDPKWNKKIIW